MSLYRSFARSTSFFRGRVDSYVDYYLGEEGFPSCGELGGFVIYAGGTIVESDIDEDCSMTAWPEAIVQLLRGQDTVEVLVLHEKPIVLKRNGSNILLGGYNKRNDFQADISFSFRNFVSAVLDATKTVAEFADTLNEHVEALEATSSLSPDASRITLSLKENFDRGWWKMVRDMESRL